MMDLAAARAFLASNSGDERYLHDVSGLAQVTELFDAGDGALRSFIWDAFATLALDGDPLESQLAARFLLNATPPEALLGPLAAAVVAGGHPNQSTLERILGAPQSRLSDEDRRALGAVFAADPARHLALAGSLVRADPRGPMWEAFETALRTSTDAAALARSFDTAYYALRQDDYLRALAERAPEVRAAVAARLPPDLAARLATLNA